MTVIVYLSCSLVKRDLWVVYFPNHVQQSYFNLLCECFTVSYMDVCVRVCDYPRCYEREAAIHFGCNKRFSSVTKQFLCFHGAMILSKSQRKQRGRGRGSRGGGGRKKSMSPMTNSSRNLAGCRHASKLRKTCLHKQWETKKKPQQKTLKVVVF